MLKIGVFCGRFVRITPGNVRGEECFSAVWFDHCDAAPVDGVPRIGIGCDYFAGSGSLASDLSYQFGATT